MSFYHSVTLDRDKCKGCTNCIKRCPTEAIRVREGRARIISERCIDCGECIRVCPHRAKLAVTDSLSRLSEYRYTVALPAPTLYGQFNNLDDIDYVLSGLIDIGFDDVFEVSKAAEIVSDATRRLIREGALKTPVISSACPAVARLIRVRFPSLCDRVLDIMSPMQAGARMAKREAREKTGLPFHDIGVFFLTPCPAKMTDIVLPVGIEESWADGAISIAEVYPHLLEKMNKIQTPRQLTKSGIIGVSWASSGGESAALIKDKYLAADGIENVIAVLDEMENERLREVEFVELNACHGGCVGGVLTTENGYVAKARINRLRKYLPVSLNRVNSGEEIDELRWQSKLQFRDVMELSPDLAEAIKMMGEADRLEEMLPALDCGSCGAPSCRALAEDIVKGYGQLNDCIFILRKEASSAGIDVSTALMERPDMDTGAESEGEATQ